MVQHTQLSPAFFLGKKKQQKNKKLTLTNISFNVPASSLTDAGPVMYMNTISPDEAVIHTVWAHTPRPPQHFLNETCILVQINLTTMTQDKVHTK